MGLTIPGAETQSLQQSANLAHQLQLIKDLLSAPITALVDDSSKIKNIFEQIESQLPESLQIKLWPASNLPFFRVEVNRAQQRIEARRSQISLKADITQRCKALNQKKATLDIKADMSANMNRLDLLKKEFAEISTLSRQIVTDDDKDDEAIIARADAIRTEAIHAIEEFLN